MVLKSVKFNHEAENLHEALTVSTTQKQRCRERVFFAAFANALQGIELYGENEDDCPREFHTKTGDLSRTLSLINDPLEYEYTLLMFLDLQPLAQDSFTKYKAMHDNDLEESSKRKLQLMMTLQDLVFQHKTEEEDMPSDISVAPSAMIKRVDIVKQSHYSWETYYNMVKAKNFFRPESKSKGSDFDIDDMLKNVFDKDDE